MALTIDFCDPAMHGLAMQAGRNDVRFGERVRDKCLIGLSQRAHGKLIGVSFTYVSKIENEKLHFDA